jgi:hypothetical protein
MREFYARITSQTVSELLELNNISVHPRTASRWDKETQQRVANWAYTTYVGLPLRAPEMPCVLRDYVRPKTRGVA